MAETKAMFYVSDKTCKTTPRVVVKDTKNDALKERHSRIWAHFQQLDPISGNPPTQAECDDYYLRSLKDILSKITIGTLETASLNPM